MGSDHRADPTVFATTDVAHGTGLRVSELVHLKIDNIDRMRSRPRG
jgi:site-specific recombinase XerD